MEKDYEKLGAFFLGRGVDPETGEVSDAPLLYDSKDLTTHGVIIGMTGSGKTGLGIGLLEEAAIDRIPVLAVDPKGDLANLLLTFPDLSAQSFRPWINEESARLQGVSPEEYASQQSEFWRKGLESWEQDGERIRRLREQADIAVYTPGSSAGLPVSVLRSFDAPPTASVEDTDAFRERIQSTVTGLLGLLGIDADPIRSREHILLSSILDDAWRKGRSLDLGALIQAIQQPPFTRLGVMELESVYPAKDRFELAMQLNALIASPGFQAWMEGEPLDIASMLYTREGKPRLTIFSIAHLGDAERMFFVTMLLSAVVAWMRGQKGTTTLRALVYMDEIFGFFPPVANPPSKGPMLTLLKQARAFGVGMVLATQNPVDLDYKGLGNTGTWFIGRLQTDRDKIRVLEALDGAMAGSTPIPREALDKLLSGLGKRVFLMHNVHRGAPVLFTTRWTMSYLAGPLTLSQLKTLSESRKGGLGTGQGAAGATLGPTTPEVGYSTPSAVGQPAGVQPGEGRPLLPKEIRQLFVPPFARGEGMVYRPAFMVVADVRYSSTRHRVEETRSVSILGELEDGPLPFALDRLQRVDLSADFLESDPVEGITFAPLPGEGALPKSYDRWGKESVRWIQGACAIVLYESKAHKVFSQVGESEIDFRMRIADLGREAKETQTEKLRQRYEPRLRTLQERLRRAEQAVEKRQAQSKQAVLNTGLSTLGAILGAASGGKGKRGTGGLLGVLLGAGAAKATTAARTAGRAAQTRQDVAHAAETVEAVQAQIEALEVELQEELRTMAVTADSSEKLDEVSIRPALNAISPRITALVWLPWGTDASGSPIPLWR